MAKITWSSQYSIGIDVIDQQHQRIVEYINQLDEAIRFGASRRELETLIHALVDYTVSHFGFEESLQEDASYPFLRAHKKVHELFIRRVSDFQSRFNNNEDVAEELANLLVTWLINHIKGDDADYAKYVAAFLRKQGTQVEQKRGLFARLFN